MPEKRISHEIVPMDNDLVVIGGKSCYSSCEQKSSLRRLTCQNGKCDWAETVMEQQLNIARYHFIAMLLPDERTDCGTSLYYEAFIFVCVCAFMYICTSLQCMLS